MGKEEWTKIDEYYRSLFMPRDPVLEQSLADSAAAGLPGINVAPNQGKLLFLAAKAMGVRKVLEIGTLGGYSTIWLARALPPKGRLITLELNPKHAEVAHKNIARAGLEMVVEVRQGPALRSNLFQNRRDHLILFLLMRINLNIPSTSNGR